MDLEKIGSFIAAERKQKSFTQKQLADVLCVSDRTVSKWECGKGFPEVSLLLPLCRELGFTVNELFAGERLSEAEYVKKAEENMINYAKEKEDNKIKMLLATLLGLVALSSFIIIVNLVDVTALTINPLQKILLLIYVFAVFIVGFTAIYLAFGKIGYFKCPDCGKCFVPGFLEYTTSLQLIMHSRLKCPHCGAKRLCRKVLTKD